MKSDYFFDVATGWDDATEYTNKALGLDDETVSVDIGLEKLGYRLENSKFIVERHFEIKILKNMQQEYTYALYIDDFTDISVVFIKNSISVRACIAQLLDAYNKYSALES